MKMVNLVSIELVIDQFWNMKSNSFVFLSWDAPFIATHSYAEAC